jgi:hypothetical protein
MQPGMAGGAARRCYQPASPRLEVLVPTQHRLRTAGGQWLSAVTFP